GEAALEVGREEGGDRLLSHLRERAREEGAEGLYLGGFAPAGGATGGPVEVGPEFVGGLHRSTIRHMGALKNRARSRRPRYRTVRGRSRPRVYSSPGSSARRRRGREGCPTRTRLSLDSRARFRRGSPRRRPPTAAARRPGPG